MRIKFQWLIICFALFSGYACLADDSGVTLQSGGTQIILDKNWEKLEQPENFFVQKRAINKEQGIAISAGVFTIDLSLQQYVALGIYGLKQGPEAGLNQATKQTAQLARIPIAEVEKAVQSRIGQQTIDQIKKASALCSFEFLSVTNMEISGAPASEIHSKMIILKSNQTIFSRQFVYSGTVSNQIVQITYASASDEIFQDNSLIFFIKRPK